MGASKGHSNTSPREFQLLAQTVHRPDVPYWSSGPNKPNNGAFTLCNITLTNLIPSLMLLSN